MWAGSADGLVHVTTDSGAHWKLVTPPELPQWAQISTIEPSHVSAGTAYLSASRYQWDDFHPYVYKTTDYGAHWTAMSDGLPDDQYVFAVRQDPRDPRVLFAGTRSTIYVSLNGGGNWQPPDAQSALRAGARHRNRRAAGRRRGCDARPLVLDSR